MPASTKKEKASAKADKAVADGAAPLANEIPVETQIEMMRQMLRIRRFEEKSAQLYQQQKIGGFCHLYIGQEAVAAGALAVTRPDDVIMTTYRDHGLGLGRGIEAEAGFAELLGRVGGCSHGRGGSMHFFSKEKNFLGGHGIVGAHIPLATGTAFASKYRGQDGVTLVFFGDGAVNNGAFHESLNLASLWKLPVIYICENNRYGMGTPVERASSIYDIHMKAEGYDMDHDCIDGMDVAAVYHGLKAAVARAREGKPSFIEIRTYRFRGHSMSDPIHSHYRTKAEVEEQKERDPIKLWHESLVARGVMTDEAIQKLDKEILAEMKKAAEAADQSPEPDPKDVFKYVLAEE